ncbi:MAG: DUF4314 domain-containing protein [Erysipelotrichaceae bacterium]
MNKGKLDYLIEKYEVGSRIRFLDDGCEGYPYGIEGVVNHVDEYGYVHINWDNGTELALYDGRDCFELINENQTMDQDEYIQIM